MDKWRHTGFNVFAGPRILPRYEKSMENLARYYGYYSNVSRGKRKKAGADDKIPGILAPDLSNRELYAAGMPVQVSLSASDKARKRALHNLCDAPFFMLSSLNALEKYIQINL